ncbi:hypothetical protein [Winogradskyella pacifica]|uniref:hypothetical protein n=1 Tax=Winogradskyella pacifica TaxID=664642 RepID=UPI0015C6B840|nr:hypothetical protein [Winogradskyella pacifica]
MWEIDTLLKSSIELISDSKLNPELKKHIVWNLENIPEVYEFDAGNFIKSELDSSFTYKKMNPYGLGYLIINEAKNNNKNHLIYDWSAFLLNFWSEYFSNIDTLEHIKLNYLEHIKDIFSKYDFTDYEPIHTTLTIYNNGNKWFSEEQNNLIKWYCN